MQSLVAMLFKDPHLPICKAHLISINDTHSIVPSMVTSSTDPVTTIDLGHHAITLLVIPLVYVPYFACHLTVLSLQENHLKSIPAALWQLTSLLELDLSHNRITYLSPFLVCLQNLRCLDVSHNQLTLLPPEFPHSLQKLDLSNNLLSSAPSVLLDLPSLNRLWIDENQFLTTMAVAQAKPSPAQDILSLRDLTVQAMARHLKVHDIHTYCHHALDFSANVQTQIMNYPIIKQISNKQTSHARQYPFLVKDDLKYLNEHSDLDPYTHQSNHSSIAANISHVPATDVDVKFAEMVHAKIVTHVRKKLNEEHALVQPYTSDSIAPTVHDFHQHGQNTRIHGLTIDIPSQTQESAVSNACPLSPLIMDWASKLPLPSLKSMNDRLLSPLTPSIPSPPSAFSTFCIFQIVPVPLLVSLIVPIGKCGVCGEGIYRTQECGMIHLTAIQMCMGNLIPLHWTLCSIACWRTARDKIAGPIRIN